VEQRPPAGTRVEGASVVVVIADPNATHAAPAPIAEPVSTRPSPRSRRSGR